MKLRTIVGGLVGIAIALLIGLLLVTQLDRVETTESPNPRTFLIVLALIGAGTGGAIAYPIPRGDGHETKL